ncbi:MAG: diacylglycerol kinase family protein [Rubrivivax sp.]
MLPPADDQPRPLVVVFNLASGHGDADAIRQTIERACCDAGRALVLLQVDRPRRLAQIAREAVARAQATQGVVVAAGGDGTINAVAQAVLGSGCTFGVLPHGTFNYFSRSHGIPDDVGSAMALLLSGSAQPVQVGQVNDQVFLVNASLGLYPRLLENREQWKRQLGRSRWVAFCSGLLSLLRGHRSLCLRIDLQGRSHEVHTPTLFVANNPLQMTQLGIDLEQAMAEGALGALVLRPVGTLRMLALLARGALGRLGEADEVVKFAFTQLTVAKARAIGARRIKVATDGEVRVMRLPLSFRVAPQPLLLIRPPSTTPQAEAKVDAAMPAPA